MIKKPPTKFLNTSCRANAIPAPMIPYDTISEEVSVSRRPELNRKLLDARLEQREDDVVPAD
ncbi:MAG: hypothetical protein Q7V05_08975 [Methanoregula sp.]|nr:hypothetical protein [Methanoregula sp.]